MEDTILEKLREELYKLIKPKEVVLSEGEILELSQKIDKLVCESYNTQ